MASYRIYCLDGVGRIGFADWFEAADDEAAIVEARRIRSDANGYEVWHRERMVARANGKGRFERTLAHDPPPLPQAGPKRGACPGDGRALEAGLRA